MLLVLMKHLCNLRLRKKAKREHQRVWALPDKLLARRAENRRRMITSVLMRNQSSLSTSEITPRRVETQRRRIVPELLVTPSSHGPLFPSFSSSEEQPTFIS